MSGIKIRKGDLVEVRTGKDRGKQGTVSRVLPEQNKVIVDGVNVATKHQKARTAEDSGGIIDKDMPLPVANVGIVCDKCSKPVRVSYRFDGDTKVRVCGKCGGDL